VVAERRLPPADTVGEQRRWAFALAEGPLAEYRRDLSASTADDDGTVEVTQVVRFRVGLPVVSWLFALPLRSHLGGLHPRRQSPWWAPPSRLPHRGALTLTAVCGLAVVAGYLDNLLPATMTYAAREYRVGDTGQGLALGVVQLSSILALVLLAAADRRGRRLLILGCSGAGALLAALGALSPSVGLLTASQVGAGAAMSAQYVLLGVLVIEEMPAGDRAWALALVTMSYGLGGGVTLFALPLADDGSGGWRWLYLLALLALPAVAACARHLPESGRWRRDVADTPRPPPGQNPARWSKQQRRRLVLLGAGALLFALFDTPAGGFQNQYLRVQRHFSAARIGLSEQVTGTIGGAGTLLGGRLADSHGRKPVIAVAVTFGTAATVAQFLTHGLALYGWMTAGSFLGYAVAPALAVYGGELFPTGLRGRAGGVLTVLGALGGLGGLAATGVLGHLFGSLGPALAVMAVGPLLLVVLVVCAYPETARRPLESLAVEPGPALAEPPAS